jgi:hypothetical protein
MSKRILISMLIGILLLPFAAVQPVAAAATTGKEDLQEVHAAYSDFDSSGCIRTYMTMNFIQHDATYVDKVKERFVETIFQYGQHNDCTGKQTLSGYILGVNPMVQMTVGAPYENARVTVNGQVFDWITGSMIPLSIDLIWTGTGPITHDNSHTNTQPSPGCRSIDINHTGYRTASVTGMASVNGIQLTNLVPDSVYFQRTTNKSVDTNCP